MRVLIAEGVPSGHRLYFVRLVVAEALERGHTVVLLASPAVQDSQEFESTLGGLALEILIESDPTDPSALSRTSRRVGSDVAIVLDADRMIMRLARRPRWDGAGTLRLLMLRSRMPHRGADRFHRARVAVKRLLLARVASMRGVEVFHLVAPRADGRYGATEIGDPVEWAAPSEVVHAWRSRLARDAFWYGVFGVVTGRKNLPLVLDVLERRSALDHAVGLLVAGRVDPDVRLVLDDYIARGTLRIEVEDRLLTEEELDAAVAAVDCVVLAHSNEGSSGIFGKALRAGTRVLAAGALTLRDACELVPSGAVWAPLTAQGVAEAAARTVLEPAPRAQDFDSNLADQMLRARA